METLKEGEGDAEDTHDPLHNIVQDSVVVFIDYEIHKWIGINTLRMKQRFLDANMIANVPDWKIV